MMNIFNYICLFDYNIIDNLKQIFIEHNILVSNEEEKSDE